jgi:hypothetical protein
MNFEEVANKGVKALKNKKDLPVELNKTARTHPSFLQKIIWFLSKPYLSFLYLFTNKVVYRKCSVHYSTFRNCRHCKDKYWSSPHKNEKLEYTKDGTYSYWPHVRGEKNEIRDYI